MNKYLPTLFIIGFLHQLGAQELERYEFHHQQMGTQFRIILYSTDSRLAQSAARQSFKKVNELNDVFSDYQEESEISKLSATAGSRKKIKVSSDLWQVLRQSQRFSKKSKGAFDLSIGPLSKLWRSMFRRKEIFNGVKINNEKNKVNYRNIRLFLLTKRVKLKQKGMRLDAGGIAKGYTVDRLADQLRKLGIQQFLVDGGGDIFIGQAPPNKAGWDIKITLEGKTGEKQAHLLVLENKAIASSGDTFRYLEWKGKRYSHIIDPRTGYGVTNSRIVNVIAPTCMEADAAASVLSILRGKAAISFLKKMKKVKVIRDKGARF